MNSLNVDQMGFHLHFISYGFLLEKMGGRFFWFKKEAFRFCLGCGLVLCCIKTQTSDEISYKILLLSPCRWTLLS